MKIRLSISKADTDSIGGHVASFCRFLNTSRAQTAQRARDVIIDHRVSHAGDDIAIAMTHREYTVDTPPALEGSVPGASRGRRASGGLTI